MIIKDHFNTRALGTDLGWGGGAKMFCIKLAYGKDTLWYITTSVISNIK